jgi:hypothetical protein
MFMSQERAVKIRKTMPYDLLTMGGNKGDLPEGIVEQVELSD